MASNKIKKTIGEMLFDGLNVALMFFMMLITLYPFLNVLAVSMSDYSEYVNHPMMFYPRKFDFSAYKLMLHNPLLLSSYKNTLFIAIVGTAVNMVLTLLTAYPLSKKYLRGNKIIMVMILFSMMFGGGMIPNYLLVKKLGLLNSLWALILPGAMSAYNMILMRTFLETIPDSLEESARMDGASDLTVLIRIILPLSMPAMAAIALFYAVSNWNIFFSAVIYTSDRSKWTLQLLLREIILDSAQAAQEASGSAAPENGGMVNTQNIKTAAIIVTVLPILMVYPFLQKYFVKGIMLGAVKQ